LLFEGDADNSSLNFFGDPPLASAAPYIRQGDTVAHAGGDTVTHAGDSLHVPDNGLWLASRSHLYDSIGDAPQFFQRSYHWNIWMVKPFGALTLDCHPYRGSLKCVWEHGFVRVMQYFDNIIIAVATLLEPMAATLIAYSLHVGDLPGIFGWIGNALVVIGALLLVYPCVDTKAMAH